MRLTNLRICVLSFCVLLCMNDAAVSDIFRYVDEDGVIRFTQTPRKGATHVGLPPTNEANSQKYFPSYQNPYPYTNRDQTAPSPKRAKKPKENKQPEQRRPLTEGEKWYSEKMAEVVKTSEEFKTALAAELKSEEDIEPLLQRILVLRVRAVDLIGQIHSRFKTDAINPKSWDAIFGKLTFNHASDITCRLEIAAAELAALSPDPKYWDIAKMMFRSIIIRYTGDAYKSFAKQAEFGLEDLKEKMAGKRQATLPTVNNQ